MKTSIVALGIAASFVVVRGNAGSWALDPGFVPDPCLAGGIICGVVVQPDRIPDNANSWSSRQSWADEVFATHRIRYPKQSDNMPSWPIVE
jgi:hypothetical protein